MDRQIARSRLDSRFASLRPLVAERPPHRGWVRAIRDALGMSRVDMASRMGVSEQSVSALERNEVRGTAQLETLRRAARALDCDLVYFVIPRTDLRASVWRQALQQAREHLAPVSHHSRLEDQTVSASDLDDQIQDLARRLIDRRGLWSKRARR